MVDVRKRDFVTTIVPSNAVQNFLVSARSVTTTITKGNVAALDATSHV